MNNKSRIAVAIAAAFGTAALGVSSGAIAQTSSVQIGGALNLMYSISKPGTASATNTNGAGGRGSHDNLSLTEPEIFIHGEEKIGSTTAWFRCTSSFDLMGTASSTPGNTTTTSTAAAGSGQWCGRNSALGFKGSFGNIYAGNWDTAAKMAVYNPVRLGWFGGTASLTGGFSNVLLNGSDSNVGNTGFSSNVRRSRGINYDSPSFSGLQFHASTSATNEATAQTTAALQAIKPRDLSLGATYKNGPLYVGIGWTQHTDYNPAGTVLGTTTSTYNGGKDTNLMLGASYAFGNGTTLSGMWTTTKYDVTNSTDLKKSGWVMFAQHRLGGPHVIRGAYFAAGDSKGSSAAAVGAFAIPGADTGAKGYNLSYSNELSKRTEVGFTYGIIDNDTNAKFSKGISGSTFGATQKVYGLNVRHKF